MLQLPADDLTGLVKIGEGGFGLVYKGWSQTLRMEVALKMIQGLDGCINKRNMKDLMDEREAMQKASNPYVLRLLGVYEKLEGECMKCGLVMEYMSNGSLWRLYNKIPDIPWALKFQNLHQIVLGMNFLHSLEPPIIHRDLKPLNILLNRHLDVQITDFGLSKFRGITSSSSKGPAGTLSYMAPEALSDVNYRPAKAYDIYSFAILMWTMFSGEVPYNVAEFVIMEYIPKGQRPDLGIFHQWSEVKMVPEAKELMIRCWNGQAEQRPSFTECSESTGPMLKEYEEEIDEAVRTVQDRLKLSPCADQISNICEDSAESSDSLFNKALRAFGRDSESTTECQKMVAEHPGTGENTEPASNEHQSTSTNHSAELFQSNLTNTIRASGDFKKICGKLSASGLLTEEAKKSIASTQSINDFIAEAGKIARKNPLQFLADLVEF